MPQVLTAIDSASGTNGFQSRFHAVGIGQWSERQTVSLAPQMKSE
jgi:hypothetical protein